MIVSDIYFSETFQLDCTLEDLIYIGLICHVYNLLNIICLSIYIWLATICEFQYFIRLISRINSILAKKNIHTNKRISFICDSNLNCIIDNIYRSQLKNLINFYFVIYHVVLSAINIFSILFYIILRERNTMREISRCQRKG